MEFLADEPLRLLSISGKNLLKRGLRAGTEAQMMPMFTSSPEKRAMGIPLTVMALLVNITLHFCSIRNLPGHNCGGDVLKSMSACKRIMATMQALVIISFHSS